jgi:predicted site-specific integrase-resolvase
LDSFEHGQKISSIAVSFDFIVDDQSVENIQQENGHVVVPLRVDNADQQEEIDRQQSQVNDYPPNRNFPSNAKLGLGVQITVMRVISEEIHKEYQ